MKFSFLTCTLLSLLAVAARAQKPEGPWQDCDGPTTHITTNSDAMLPAIASGRRLLVTCFTHAIRGSSIAAGQVRLASLSPPLARGDLVAFHRPDNPAQVEIRRVIAVQDQRVQVRDLRVMVDDAPMHATRIGDNRLRGANGTEVAAVRIHEAIARGFRGYDILIPAGSTYGNDTSEPIQVPQRFIYVLPDNRVTTPNILAQDLNLVPLVNLIGRIEEPK
jgi:signal peptidase I